MNRIFTEYANDTPSNSLAPKWPQKNKLIFAINTWLKFPIIFFYQNYYNFKNLIYLKKKTFTNGKAFLINRKKSFLNPRGNILLIWLFRNLIWYILFSNNIDSIIIIV
jgi:hypothetical protein